MTNEELIGLLKLVERWRDEAKEGDTEEECFKNLCANELHDLIMKLLKGGK